ncbi:MAG: TonB-dependent receptor [Proteobacteria bacterium]|nr:TonB-dependent receptor [Pseudomonadota bacterium]
MRAHRKSRGGCRDARGPSRQRWRAPSPIAAAVATALGAALPLPAAFAANADVAATSLQEVVVTARKRTENLQDVPISVDVFTSRDMKNLAITGFDDYAQKVPSISFISTGPGTQVFVMRGASDGSNPNYGNTSMTGFFVDDMSMSDSASQPDLHLYDIERIEVLNGPQGTTYGAGSMAGAIRYITNKPDLHSFSAGVDFNAGQIQSAQQNWTYEGFINIPLIDGVLGLRASAFSDSHGGFINNALTTRTWVNGAVSDNSPWARRDYNRENVVGGRIALKAALGEKWDAVLTFGYQRQHTLGAWDEDPALPARTVTRFGPESESFETRMLDLHVDGDVGIGDLVFASTYWAQPRRQWNEYSQYMENYAGGSREGFACLNDPTYGTGPFSGCLPPLQFYLYTTHTERWSDELRLSSKPGGRFHWLAGLYWEKTRDNGLGNTYYMPGLQYNGAAFQSYLNYYGLTQATLPAGEWYSYIERTDYLQTTEFANISFDLTDRLNVEGGIVHFHSRSKYYTPYVQFAYYTSSPSIVTSGSSKVNGKLGVNYKITDRIMAYANWGQGFRDGGSNAGSPQSCYDRGVPLTYTPDTLNNYELGLKTRWLNGRLVWNSALYDMEWKKLQTLIYNPAVCPSSSYNINVGNARAYGAETNIDFQVDPNWTLQASLSYTDSRIISGINSDYQGYVGERLPFAPYFSWSWNARYEHPVGDALHAYFQFDMAHKGDMWNGLNPIDKNNGLPRILQPSYTIANVRIGLNPGGERWLAELYVTNLTDKNAIVYSNSGNFDLRETTNEPRTYGLRLSYRWGKGAE